MRLPATTAQDATRSGTTLLVTARTRVGLYAREGAVLAWLAPLAILHALMFVVLAPPWQHYDEPAHFLYAAEVSAGEVDAPGQVSERLRRIIADSMYRFRFFAPGAVPDILAATPPEVGISQRGHPLLYYALVASALRPFTGTAIETQLYIARLVSVALYTLTVLTAWRIAVALAPDEPLVQLVIPILTLLIPTFVDIMTAVNNDVLLNFSLTVALLGAVLLVRDGLRPLPFALMVLGATVGILTKRTAVFALVPLLLAMLWTLWRAPMRWWVLPLIVVATALVTALVALEPAAVDGAQSTLTLRPWLATLSRDYLRIPLDALVRSLTDTSLIGDRYWTLLQVGFSGYYTHFAWGNVVLHPGWTLAFAALSLVALVGLIVGSMRLGTALPLWQQRCLWFFLVCVVVAWVSLFLRLHPLPPLNQPSYVPRARYMFWAIVPTLWLLVLGLSWAAPMRWRRFVLAGVVGLFVCLNLAAWYWTLAHYFHA